MLQDIELLELYARTRDAGPFNDLVTRYADLVYGTCVRVTGNVEDARDAAQDCFLALARQAGEIRASLPARWLTRIRRQLGKQHGISLA